MDLVVSELLDSTLLGEGYLPSLRDLARRGFLRKGAWFWWCLMGCG